MFEWNNKYQITYSREIPLWRYIDFWKFLDLLNSSMLFFPSIEMLGDQHEGKIPKKLYNELVREEERWHRFSSDNEEIYPFNNDKFYKYYYQKYKSEYKKNILVSSWNVQEFESFAMWKMYGKEKLGIAIRTSFERLKKSFNSTDRKIYIGEVYYCSEDTNTFDMQRYRLDFEHFNPFLAKTKYYEFESEIRCITSLDGDKSNLIKVDLNELIETIYISPFSVNFGFQDVIGYLKKKHNLDFDIKISGVQDKWI